MVLCVWNALLQAMLRMTKSCALLIWNKLVQMEQR